MLTRRAVFRLPALGLLARAGWPASPTTKRALVVGINEYHSVEPPPESSLPGSTAHSSAAASVQRGTWGALDGCVNDATLMQQILKDRFGFPPANVVFLKDRDATRDRILEEFKRHLIDSASPGDTSLFYYAGHGSQVKNLGSPEAGQMDETLVPVDVPQGARDIRDKEMARLYRAATQKSIALTVILDSCHSGGMARGAWNGTGKVRYVPADPRPINDPPDRDPVTGEKLPDAASLGVLFLFAARDDQLASEASTTERGSDGQATQVPHGAFTAALARVLQSATGGQSVEQICERVQSMLASQGKTQIPICAGKDRGSRGLLGQPAGLGASITVSVVSVGGEGQVRLHGGSALGLAPGCALVRTNGQQVRLELTRVDFTSSEAKMLAGASASAVQPGDLFRLDTWVAHPSGAVKVYFCKTGPDAGAVLAVARAIAGLANGTDIEILSEITTDKPPTHVLDWRDGAYFLERNPADGHPARLGSSPTAGDLSHALAGAGSVRLWAILPPDRLLASNIRLGAGTENLAVQVAGRPADSVYFLAGHLNGGAVEYAWFFKDILGLHPAQARLPLRTDWKPSGEQLTVLALSLARIYGWLNIDSPPGGEESFPYSLGLEKAGTQEKAGGGPFKIGEKFKFVFEASPEALKQADSNGGVDKRYVYVFAIDSTGQAQCLFPDPANGNEKNLIPRGEVSSPRIEATRNPYDIAISEPVGVDNYFLVATREPMDPGIFQWSGVRSAPESRRGAGSSLEFLFSSVGEGRRGVQAGHTVPVTWSIQSMPLRSVR